MSFKQKVLHMVWITGIVFLVMGMMSTVFAEQKYSDVNPDDSHYDAIMALTEAEVVKGYEDGRFGQWDVITRQHVAVILFQAYDLDVPENIDEVLEAYEDVDSNHLYAEQIAAVTEAGIFKGSNGYFNPTKPITREQVASVILLAEGLDTYNTIEEVSIHLDNVDDSHKDRVQVLANLGITNQLDDYRPKEHITRGAFATLLQGTFEKSSELSDFFTLDLMHTSDTHAHLDNVAKRVTAVNAFRSEHPEALLFDSGDVFSGTLYFNEFHGQADLEFMNLMGYDGMTFGNHEFDLGDADGDHSGLAEFIENAAFPIIATNVDVSKDPDLRGFFNEGISDEPEAGQIYEGIIREVNGEKIGIFGLTTEETVDISSPLDVAFENYLEEAENIVAKFKEQGVDKIVAITHIGFSDNPVSNDLDLAKRVEGIDVILGGHSHTKLDKPVVVMEDVYGNEKAPTLISHTFQYSEFLGTLNVKFDENGEIVGFASELVEISSQEEDGEAKALLKEYADVVEKIMNEEIGAEAAHNFENPRGEVSVRNSETALGNLITDGMLAEAKKVYPETVAAFHNGGNIREALDEGPITTGEIMTIMPFGNTIATMRLTGKEIMETLEFSVRLVPGESGGFLHVSGLKFEYDSSKPEGERVQSVQVMIDGEYVDLEEDQEYVIVTNAFIAKGGDGYKVLENAYLDGRMQDLGIIDWENFRNYLIQLAEENEGKVSHEIEGRIVDLARE